MAAPGAGPQGRLVQYVVVRTDLVQRLSWPLGAVVAQACHAATAAVHLHYGDPDTQRYLAQLDSMHKVVLGVSLSRLLGASGSGSWPTRGYLGNSRQQDAEMRI